MRRTAILGSVLGALMAFLSGNALACGRDSACTVEHGTYRVSAPQGWDGRSPLPAALFFHGYQQSAADVMRDEAMVAAFSQARVLLVAIDGLGKTWTFPGSPSQARDDAAFALEVLDDVERRFPVDRSLVWATGFSQGGSMVWWLACKAGERFAAFAPVAGAFWEPIPTDCLSGPASILHTHGLADETVPMAGRALGGGRFRQGDVMRGLAVWRRVDQCRSEEPDEFRTGAGVLCRGWTRCGSGRELRLCLHEGGHEMQAGWVADAFAFVRAAAARRPASH